MAVPTSTPKRDSAGKVIIEALIAIFLHPIAFGVSPSVSG